MNRLQYETSPYLLQHAHNPVDWYAWKPEAFEKAKKEDKPILVSIGYSTCHWCHVMERESFENEEIATFMNEHFVNIKVDREERPDVDAIYMEAVQILSGSGGWPLNCFLTPDKKPFFAGTYYPPRPAHQRPSWIQILQNIYRAFMNQRDVVEDQAEKLLGYIKKGDTSLINNEIAGLEKEAIFTPELVNHIYKNLKTRFDVDDGGFGGTPKFPGAMSLQFLLNYFFHTGNETARDHVFFSLNKMIFGGIYDQIGGGFSRYAVDKEWLVPHFEKMLYDNALLVSVLSDAYKVSGKKLYQETIEEILEFVAREMTSDEGGFYAALDADSEGVEGKFYVWDKKEIDEILENDALVFNDFYGVTEEGNWEEKNILNRTLSVEDFFHAFRQTGSKKKKTQNDVEDFKLKIKNAGKKLLEEREKRIRPGLDDKILLSWNALQCSAYAKAYSALQNEKYKIAAEKNISFLLSRFVQEDGLTLFHTYKEGKAQYDAFLDDYSFLIEALLDVYEINFNAELIDIAGKYLQFVIENFYDKTHQLFFYTSEKQKDIVVRKRDVYDSAMPSGNSTMVRNLQRLSILLDSSNYRDLAVKMLLSIQDSVKKYPSSFSGWSNGILNEVFPINEIAIVGEEAMNLASSINKDFFPNKILMATVEQNHKYPLLENKIPEKDTYIYVCRNYTCQQPVKTIDEFKKMIT